MRKRRFLLGRHLPKCFNTASGMDCMQYVCETKRGGFCDEFQYRKRYGLHAINLVENWFENKGFQYRKRYGLHAIYKVAWIKRSDGVSIPQAVWIACNLKKSWGCMDGNSFVFQYRKRYGLHAITKSAFARGRLASFNTASGMDCMQCRDGYSLSFVYDRFNTASGMDCMQ